MKGYMYILLCENGSYYTGSTIDLDRRLIQHHKGEGANYTRKHPPVVLVYVEEFEKISEAFYREKQVQGWTRAKKEALISGITNELHRLAECKNKSHFKNTAFDVALTAETALSTLLPERSRRQRSSCKRNRRQSRHRL